jgi:phosphoenolpyruvate carboxykinase (GTP)
VWWEGADGEVPQRGIDWQGNPWKPGMLDAQGKPALGANANSRFTTPIEQCPTASFRLNQHHGVPISAIIFGGRRAHLAPLVYEAFNWRHGVFMGATMASERTAAQVGKQGEVRRDPMAMLPFCGYNMATYFKHWLNMGHRMSKTPRIFNVNWFRMDEHGKFLWPGFRENLRILEWIVARCDAQVGAQTTAIGYIPDLADIDMTGLAIPHATMDKLFKLEKKDWYVELEGIKKFFKMFRNDFPQELWDEYEGLHTRLAHSKDKR